MKSPHLSSFVNRFALLGATLGLLVGFIEAALRYAIPWVSTLLAPTAGWVIFLLAPLLNLALLGSLGAVLGGLAGAGHSPSALRVAALACVLIAVAGAMLGWAHHLLRIRVADLEAISNIRPPLFWFAVVFASTTVAAWLLRRRLTPLSDPEARWPVGLWALALAAIAAILSAGLGLYAGRGVDLLARVRSEPSSTSSRPNIVLISLDTVRADRFSAYGYSRPTTPNFDALAREGMLFENAVAPSSWTLPSHASVFTGLLPHQHGANVYTPLAPSPRTLAEILTAEGYETASFNANIGYGQLGWGLAQGFKVYDEDRLLVRHNLVSTLAGRAILQPLYHYAARPDFYFRRDAREVNANVLRWFRKRSARPFFVFINYFDAHDPYFAPPPFRERFGNISHRVVRRVSFPKGGFPLDPPLSLGEHEELLAGYDNGLAYLDDQVGKLLAELARSPDWANTLVIVFSDHGESFGEHGMYLHGRNVYHREALHVPLILVGPGIPSGLRLTHVARLSELFPTILDLALPNRLPALRESLRRFWTPGYQPDEDDNAAVSQILPFLPDFQPAMISLMTNEWHYIQNSRGGRELYQWPADPHERINLAASADHQQTVRELHDRLERIIQRSHGPWRAPEYLYALDTADGPFLAQRAFAAVAGDAPSYRVGMTQAVFKPDPDTRPKRPPPSEEDLIRSLPYR
jgi:arylsulfatase A-like enzyme